MKHSRLRTLIFLALCCDLGLFAKRIIAPVANILTDAMHIPGGIGTAFSLMFLVLAASFVPRFGCAALMGLVQSALALGFGMTGSLGALAPIGYIVPALVIDVTLAFLRKVEMPLRLMVANMLSACAASLAADVLVFHLPLFALGCYLAVSLLTGAICGLLAGMLHRRLRTTIMKGETQ